MRTMMELGPRRLKSRGQGGGGVRAGTTRLALGCLQGIHGEMPWEMPSGQAWAEVRWPRHNPNSALGWN